MDRDGTIDGEQVFRTGEGDGNGYSREYAVNYKAVRYKTMGWVIVLHFLLSIVFGMAASKSGLWAIGICVFGGIIGMIAGVSLEWLRNSVETFDLKGRLLTERMMNDVQCRKLMIDAQEKMRIEYNGLMIKCARVVANKVANRILARHANRLLEPEWREATLKETDKMVTEEISVLETALEQKKQD